MNHNVAEDTFEFGCICFEWRLMLDVCLSCLDVSEEHTPWRTQLLENDQLPSMAEILARKIAQSHFLL